MDSWTLWLANTKAAVIPYAELLIPLAVLIVGWIAALIASGLIRRLLAKTNLDNRLIAVLVGEEAESRIEAERWISRGVFYLVMLFVLVGFFPCRSFFLRVSFKQECKNSAIDTC